MLTYEKPLSRSELARALDIDRTTLWNWERTGKLTPPVRVSGNRSEFGISAQMQAADLARGGRP